MNPRDAISEPQRPGLSAGVRTGLAVAVGAILGAILSTIGTGIHACELLALQRQAAAIESIAETLKKPSPSMTPPPDVVWQ